MEEALITRPSWDEYYMNIAKVVATRSSCIRRQVGAVIVVDNRLVSTGYNGTPRGTTNCDKGGCVRCNTPKGQIPSGVALDECLCSHAEENAIVQAAYHGIAIKDATIYSTFQPCLTCTKMIINGGIKRVLFDAPYGANNAAEKLLSAVLKPISKTIWSHSYPISKTIWSHSYVEGKKYICSCGAKFTNELGNNNITCPYSKDVSDSLGHKVTES